MAKLQHDDPELIQGWPEYGELNGKRVRLTQSFVDGLDFFEKRQLAIDRGHGLTRPFRFAGGASDIGFGSG